MTRIENNKFMLRFPEGLREKVKDEARKARRSMNAEIVLAIEAAMQAKEARHERES